MSNSLDPDQDRHFVGPDPSPNCLQMYPQTTKVAASKENANISCMFSVCTVRSSPTCDWPKFYVNKDMFCSVLLCNYDKFIQSMVGGWGFLLFCLQNVYVHVLLLLITVNITP